MTNPIVDPLVESVDTSPTSNLVDFEATVDGAVTVLLNQPARQNALNPDLISALEEAFRTLAGAEGVRVIFVRGLGGAFCAGSDPDWLQRALDRAEDENRDDALDHAKMLKQLWDLPQLTVALVEGAAYGAGAGLAAACDLAVATADATFAFSDVRMGLIPATIAPYVVDAVGPRQARSLFATGRLFDAEHARRIGLVSEVCVDAVALDAARDRIASDILACAPGAVGEAKRLVGEVAGRAIDHDLLEHGARRQAAVFDGEEGQEGVRAYIERRPPSWAVDGGPG
jgi:methylglutaconyl-CoA hydratase